MFDGAWPENSQPSSLCSAAEAAPGPPSNPVKELAPLAEGAQRERCLIFQVCICTVALMRLRGNAPS